MTKAQAVVLRSLASEMGRPRFYEPGLSVQEAERRINELKRDIELANSF